MILIIGFICLKLTKLNIPVPNTIAFNQKVEELSEKEKKLTKEVEELSEKEKKLSGKVTKLTNDNRNLEKKIQEPKKNFLIRLVEFDDDAQKFGTSLNFTYTYLPDVNLPNAFSNCLRK